MKALVEENISSFRRIEREPERAQSDARGDRPAQVRDTSEGSDLAELAARKEGLGNRDLSGDEWRKTSPHQRREHIAQRALEEAKRAVALEREVKAAAAHCAKQRARRVVVVVARQDRNRVRHRVRHIGDRVAHGVAAYRAVPCAAERDSGGGVRRIDAVRALGKDAEGSAAPRAQDHLAREIVERGGELEHDELDGNDGEEDTKR